MSNPPPAVRADDGETRRPPEDAGVAPPGVRLEVPLEAILGVLVAFADAGATKNPVSLDGASGLVPLETMPWRLGVSNVAPIACSASEAAAATAGDAGAGAGMSGPGPGSACAAAGDIAGDSGVAEGGTTCVAGGDGIKAIDGRPTAGAEGAADVIGCCAAAAASAPASAIAAGDAGVGITALGTVSVTGGCEIAAAVAGAPMASSAAAALPCAMRAATPFASRSAAATTLTCCTCGRAASPKVGTCTAAGGTLAAAVLQCAAPCVLKAPGKCGAPAAPTPMPESTRGCAIGTPSATPGMGAASRPGARITVAAGVLPATGAADGGGAGTKPAPKPYR